MTMANSDCDNRPPKITHTINPHTEATMVVQEKLRTRITLIDPTTQPIVPEFEGAPRLSDLANKRVGVIDDSKVNAKEYLAQLTDMLNERFGIASLKYHAKPSASKPADPAVVAEMAQECDYIIVGVGD